MSLFGSDGRSRAGGSRLAVSKIGNAARKEQQRLTGRCDFDFRTPLEMVEKVGIYFGLDN